MELPTRRCYWILGFFSIVLIAAFVLLDSLAPAGRRLAKVGGIDPVGYFDVAHSLLFDRDFDLTNEFQRIPPDDNPWTRIQKRTGRPGSVWPIGYSLLAIPFLAAGTVVDRLAGNPADGFSHFAILGYCLTNVVLTCVGLMALFSFLHRTSVLWNVSPGQSAGRALFVTAAVFFGTTVSYYAFSEMSHACEFCFISLFLAYWWKVRARSDLRSWAVLGLIGGVLSICRWQDSLYLIAPLLFDIMNRSVREDAASRLRRLTVYSGVAALCWLPQCLEWISIYGRFSLFPPLGNGFFVFPPRFVPELLFSSRSGGWLLWTPLCLLGLGGLLFGLVKMRRVVLPWIVPLALEILLIGSTTTWEGGNSFGARYLTSTAPLIGFGLVTLLCTSSRALRRSLMAVVLAACLFTIAFAIQFRLDLIPHGERLTVAECFTDKLRIPQARRRELAVSQAAALLQQGSATAAVEALERAAKNYGEDRALLRLLAQAYRACGREAEATSAERQWNALMQSRLW